MQHITAGFSTVTSNLRYGAGAMASMAKTATVQGVRALDTFSQYLEQGQEFVGGVYSEPHVMASELAQAAAQKLSGTKQRLLESTPGRFLTRGKLGQGITKIAVSAAAYAAFSAMPEDSPEAFAIKSMLVALPVLAAGVKHMQSRQYKNVKDGVLETGLVLGSTALAAVAPGFVGNTVSWMAGGYAVELALDSNAAIGTSAKATEFAASILTSAIPSDPVSKFVVYAAASSAVSTFSRIVSGEQPVGSALREKVRNVVALTQTTIAVLRNPMLQVKEWTDRRMEAFLANLLPAITQRLSKPMTDMLASHGVQITMNGFLPFMEVMNASAAVQFAHNHFQRDPTPENLDALRTAMQIKLKASVLGYAASNTALQSTIEGIAELVVEGHLQTLEAMGETWIGLPILETERRAYLKGIASSFLTAYVPYLVVKSPSLMSSMSHQDESALIQLGLNVAQRAVAETRLAALSPAVALAEPVLNAARNVISQDAANENAALPALSGNILQIVKASLLQLLIALFAFFHGIYARLSPAEVKPAKAAPGPQVAELRVLYPSVLSTPQIARIAVLSL